MDKLFKKYQKALLAFANTQFGRSYIGHSGREAYDKFPIVKIDRSGFVQLLGFNSKKHAILRLITYPGTKQFGEIHDKLFGTILTKLEIASQSKYLIKNSKELPFVIPHFMGATSKLFSKLPQVFLAGSTFNPQAGGGGGNVTVDGNVQQSYTAGSGVAWATIRAAAGNGAANNSTVGSGYQPIEYQADTISNQFQFMSRGGYTFDTSTLVGATDVTATLSIYGQGKTDAGGGIPDINIYSFTPANANNVVAGDFAQTGTTAYCDTAVTYAGWSSAAYNDFVLNATGIAAISLTGVSKFSAKNANHDVANSAPTWGSAQESTLQGIFADNGTNIPKLVVTYTAPITSANSYAYFM